MVSVAPKGTLNNRLNQSLLCLCVVQYAGFADARFERDRIKREIGRAVTRYHPFGSIEDRVAINRAFTSQVSLTLYPTGWL